MRRPVTAERYVHAPSSSVLAALAPGAATGSVTVAGTREVPWTRTLSAHRAVGTWRRAGAGGPATVDVVPAGDWALVSVTLGPGRSLRATPSRSDAARVLESLRATAEEQAHPAMVSDLLTRRLRTPELVAAAVGYSRP